MLCGAVRGIRNYEVPRREYGVSIVCFRIHVVFDAVAFPAEHVK